MNVENNIVQSIKIRPLTIDDYRIVLNCARMTSFVQQMVGRTIEVPKNYISGG